MLSTHDRLIGIERVGRLDRTADDHRVEALVLAQLVLPVHERLQLFRSTGFQTVDGVFGHDGEERDVDCIDAFAQDGPLPPSLSHERFPLGAGGHASEKAAGILEIVAVNHL